MRKFIIPFAIFFTVFIVYFAAGTDFVFKPKWTLDYFNLLAESLRKGRINIVDSGTTYDLIHFEGKWYVPWGILPALFLIPPQILLNRFIPTIYLTIFFASLDVAVFYLLLKRLREEFLPSLNNKSIFSALFLFAFGTTHFYVGTLGSSWHTDQMVTNFFGTLGLYTIFRRKREFRHYFLSVLFFSISLIGRGTIVLLSTLPALFYLSELSQRKKKITLRKDLLIGVPLLFFTLLFFIYNYIRFNSPFEYGYNFIQEASYLQERRETNGVFSLKHIPYNAWYMLFEVPGVTLSNGVKLNFNLKGNSIFFLTPPLLAIFLVPINIYTIALLITSFVTIFPSLMIYSSGWMQFGYRYSLDITAILVILSLFGVKGKLNILYILGIAFAIYIHWLGINALV